MKQVPFDFSPDKDVEQRRRVIRSQQTTLRELATRLDHISEDLINQPEKDDAVE